MTGRYSQGVFPGARFGMLTVIERLPREAKPDGKKGFYYRVRCRCDCGAETVPLINNMTCGYAKSCGCLNQRKIRERARERAEKHHGMIVKGARFGRLTVIRRIEKDGNLTDRVRCRCDCGNKTKSSIDGLARGTTQSCGCLASEMLSERNRTGGKYEGFSSSFPKTHTAWYQMVSRCLQPSHTLYAKYGAKGVRVCHFLAKDPRNLVRVIGKVKKNKPTLDRYPIHNGNYTCGKCKECRRNGWDLNVRWASSREQMLNRGSYNVFLEAFGQRLSKSQWVERTGLSWSTLNNRLARGWSVEKALTTPDKQGHCYLPSSGVVNV